MSFYKNVGGIKEYTIENIENAYIPVDTPFIFTYERNLKVESIVLVPRDTSELPIACKDCFFDTFTKGVSKCPVCIESERKDGKDVAFLVLQML